MANEYWMKRVLAEMASAHLSADKLEIKLHRQMNISLNRIRNCIKDLVLEIEENGGSASDFYRLQSYMKLYSTIGEEAGIIAQFQSTQLEKMLGKVWDQTYTARWYWQDGIEDGARNVIKQETGTVGSFFIKSLNNQVQGVTATSQIREAVLNAQWSGKDFSQTIWANADGMAQELRAMITDCLASGHGMDKKALYKYLDENATQTFGKQYYMADRVVRTETSRIVSSATLQRYRDNGVEQVEIVCAIDERLCDSCGEYDRKVYKIDNAPFIPVHPNCRCCYAPVVDE